MRTSVAALALAAALVSPAFAQQGGAANSGSSTNAPMTMAPATQPSGTTAAPGTTTGPAASPNNPGMTGSAMGNTGAPVSRNDAVRTDGGTTPTTATPAAGANSFTEAQARGRIEAAGYTGVQELKKDEAGVWRGRAMRNGQTADVGLDYQGNVVTGASPAR